MINQISIDICILTFKRPKEIVECLLSVIRAYEYYHTKTRIKPKITITVREQSAGSSITQKLLDLIKSHDYIDLIREDDLGFQKTTLDFYWNFQAEYGWFIADDDIIEETAIKTVIDELTVSRPTIAMFNYDIFKKERHKIKIHKALGKRRLVLNKFQWLEMFHIHPAMPSNVLLKRDTLRKDIKLDEQLLSTEWAGLYIQYASFDKTFKGVFSPKIIAGYRANNALQNYNWDYVFAKSVPELLRTLEIENYPKSSINKALRKTFLRYILPEIFYCTVKLRFKVSRLNYFYKNYLGKSILQIEYHE
ncbi:hypothetical protein OAN81_06615 [Paracoccaceae bacterium]|nr:hypothetical protein [Paracoccaceae bacterium]